MILTAEEAFQKWLDELMIPSKKTRLEFAKESGTDLSDLEWAFVSGYCRGQQSEWEKK